MPPSTAMRAGPVKGEVGSEGTGLRLSPSTCANGECCPSPGRGVGVVRLGEVPGSCDIRSWLGVKGAYGTAPCAEDARDGVWDPLGVLADPALSGGLGDGMFHCCYAGDDAWVSCGFNVAWREVHTSVQARAAPVSRSGHHFCEHEYGVM